MESSYLNGMFDNKYVMYSDKALELIKLYFGEKMPLFNLIDKYKESTGYWGVKYSYNDITIFINSGRGFLLNEIIVDQKEFNLFHFEPRMANIKLASKKNIQFTLDVIQQWFKANVEKSSFLP